MTATIGPIAASRSMVSGLDVATRSSRHVVQAPAANRCTRRSPQNGGTSPPDWGDCNREPPEATRRLRPARQIGSTESPRLSSSSPFRPSPWRGPPPSRRRSRSPARALHESKWAIRPSCPPGSEPAFPAQFATRPSAARPASSTSPSRKGVTRATVQPAKSRPLVGMPSPGECLSITSRFLLG